MILIQAKLCSKGAEDETPRDIVFNLDHVWAYYPSFSDPKVTILVGVDGIKGAFEIDEPFDQFHTKIRQVMGMIQQTAQPTVIRPPLKLN